MSINRDIAIRKSLEDICKQRDLAIGRYTDALRLISEAQETLTTVERYVFPYRATPQLSVDEFTKDVDARLWTVAFRKTGLGQYMDATARHDLNRSLDTDAPPFTVDNVRSTLLSVMQQADTMFARGLVELFRRLSKNHKTNTNEPFRVNERAIISYIVADNFGGGLTIHFERGDMIDDLDRVLQTLAGEKYHEGALRQAMNEAFAKREEYDGEYLSARAFKNGNLHLHFKREDLLNKANRIIADYCGRALAN